MAKTQIYKVTTVKLAIEKSLPPRLVVFASGEVTTSGWTGGELQPYVYVTPPADGIYEFDFVAEPPTGVSLQVISPITAKEYVWADFPKDLKGVRINSITNSIIELL